MAEPARKNICEDPGFLSLKKRILQDTGLDCSKYKDPYLQRRFNVRMRSTGCHSYECYRQHLIKNPSEYEKLLSEITINVTQFFRDAPVFKVLREEVLPLVVYQRVKENDPTIRVWSAGCSSGEEPYSVAMIIHDLLGEAFGQFKVEIVASDIDEEMLAAAEMGEYLPRQVVGVPKDILSTYFLLKDGSYVVRDDIKRMVRLKRIDLFSETAGKGFDMVLCRNVVIYFNREMQERLYMKFLSSLRPRGYFVMGNTETLVGPAVEGFHTTWSRERIYQKIGE